ncbi:MAG TPA: ATP-binding cassette domain-containing protein [Candidatus Aphodomonas merdavium]|nr:ATP-binding cassette domain-containing protein [Candidatus Aphodomonas merdavium]
MSDLLQVKNLVQEFKNKQSFIDSLKVRDGKIVREQKVVHAVNDISFTIAEGEAFSLVGESGCGKSTAARTIIRLLTPTSGEIIYRGKDIAPLKDTELLPYRKKIQMIFQDPYSSLDPRQKVKDILMEPILFHKLAPNRKAAETRCYELMERVGLRPEQADRYPHQFSGGQRQRIGIARALAVEPEFIIADEPVSALDVSIQAQILNLMMDLKDEFHFSYLFISHDLSVVKHISDRLGVMYLGALVECGSKQDLFERMSHPYTKMLLSAVPTVGEKPLVESMEMVGEIPSPIDLPSGCFFHGRCPYAMPICSQQRPELKQIEPGHYVACHLCPGKEK